MRVVRLHFRVVLLLTILYISLMVALYLYLNRDKFLLIRDFLLDSRTRSLSPPLYEEVMSEELNLSFKRLPGQSIHVQNGEHAFKSTNTTKVLARFAANESADTRHSTHTLNYCLHTFYYLWYGNATVDGQYIHWDHRYIPHWDDTVTDRFPNGRHKPPDDIGASYYPLLGPYSSADPATMEDHVILVKRAGIGVLAVSWFPPGKADDEGIPVTPLIPKLLDIAQKHSMKVVLHSEPYNGRTPITFVQDLKYMYEHYYNHPALLKVQGPLRGDIPLPLVYVYDSYLSSAKRWSEVLSSGGTHSIRGREYDCVAIGLLVSKQHKAFIQNAGFDGFYSYFAVDRFSYGSNTDVWDELAMFAAKNSLLFIPSAGPGYDDTQVRPWNAKNKKTRNNGQYYTDMMKQAFKHNTGGVVSITSFNEWHEGTQIEPAVPKTIKYSSKHRYLDYRPHDAWFYIDLTANLSRLFECKLREGVSISI